jgi:hypothetical protein
VRFIGLALQIFSHFTYVHMLAILQKLNLFAIFILGAFLCPCQSHEHLPAIAVNHLSLFTVVHLFYIQAQQFHVIL